MNFDKIVSEAMDVAIKAVIDEGNRSTDNGSNVPAELKDDIDTYRPVINYVNALVAESLRLYHEQVVRPKQSGRR